MKINSFNRTALAGAVLGLAALFGTAGTAGAAPLLQIVSGAGGAPLAAFAEVVGDAGGSNHANAPTAGATAGVGLPTVAGGWADTTSFGNSVHGRGISGYDGSYLNLTQAAAVTFQFAGKGNAVDHDVFQLFLGGNWSLSGTTKAPPTARAAPLALP